MLPFYDILNTSDYLQVYYEILKKSSTKWIRMHMIINYKHIPKRTFSSQKSGGKVGASQVQTKAPENGRIAAYTISW